MKQHRLGSRPSSVFLVYGLVTAAPPAAVAQAPLLPVEPDPPPRTRPLKTSEFHKELGRNFRALFTPENIRPLAVGAFFAGAAAAPEQDVEDFFGSRRERFETAGDAGERAGDFLVISPIVGGLFAAGRFAGDDKFRYMTYSLAQGFLVNSVVTGGLKEATRRRRPDRSNTNSFPSGHTSTGFMWATVMSRAYGWKAGLPAYLAAGFIGASRLEDNSHHLTDVVAGATIGYLVGRTVTRRRTDGREPRFRWSLAPSGGGVAGSLSFQLGKRR